MCAPHITAYQETKQTIFKVKLGRTKAEQISFFNLFKLSTAFDHLFIWNITFFIA